MRASSMRAAAVAAVLLGIAGCGAPDFGDEPRSYSSNWPQADPTPSETSSASPSAEPTEASAESTTVQDDDPTIRLPDKLGGQAAVRGGANQAGAVRVLDVTRGQSVYGSGAKAFTLFVYAASGTAFQRAVRAHQEQLQGPQVGRSTCATKPGGKVCWRSGRAVLVSVTGSPARSLADIAAATDEAWKAQSTSLKS